MTDYVVQSGSQRSDRITMAGADTLLVEATGTLSVSASNQAVRFTGATDSAQITNHGLIEATSDAGDARAIRFEDTIGATLNATITNGATGIIRARSDAVQIQAGSVVAGLLTIDNAGEMRAFTGQALDLAGAFGDFTVALDNSGTITANESDALRFGAIGNVVNSGSIDGGNALAYSGADGVEYGDNATGSVTNEEGGTISGDRHGINAGIGSAITVLNNAGGTLEGRNGSGVGSDGTATVTNYGTIRGSFSDSPGSDGNGATPGAIDGGGPDGVNDGDGDGIDIDGEATIVNGGLIHGVSAGGTGSDGLGNTAEGIAAGGGTFDNLAAGIIRGGGLGILIDNSSQGNAPFRTQIDNDGLIEGLTGTGIRIVSILADTIINNGTINGGNGFAIQFGAGDNRLAIEAGSAMTGIADGEGGTNTLDYRNFGAAGVAVNLTAGTATGTGGVNNFTTVFGSAGIDTLTGSAAAELLNGAGGADRLSGRGGDDRYLVDHAGDKVFETADGGSDSVAASISYALALTAHVETLTTASRTGTAAINLSGSDIANSLVGNAGANRLDGKGGADLMSGLGGNDTYLVDDSRDRVVEASGGGTDQIQASANYTLRAGVHVETLRTASAAGLDPLNLAGNELANSVIGNNGANRLGGGDGNDMLSGSGGNDRLYGGLGNDRLTGGDGEDGFYFDTALNGTLNVDHLLGYAFTDDTIRLDRAVFAGIAAGTLTADAFHSGGATAQDAEDRIVFDQLTGRIFYDADGAGGADGILFATVVPGTHLFNTDFVGYG
jgi:hypothetical protein